MILKSGVNMQMQLKMWGWTDAGLHFLFAGFLV